jgi:hypothetical protein
MSNLRLAVRMLLRTPGLTAIAVLSLAIGIGANSAIFSVYNQMLKQPLPVFEPDRLVNLAAPGPKHGSTSSNSAGDRQNVFSYPMFRDLEQAKTRFSGIAAHRLLDASLTFKGQTSASPGMLVSGSYFGVLGLSPAAGRLIGREDDRTPGGHPVVVLSHAYWQTRFAMAPTAVGETLVVNALPMTIIGVAPEGFRGTTRGSDPAIFVPLSMRERLVANWKGLDDRRNYWAYLFARLAPGATVAEATAAVNAPYTAILNEVEAGLQKGMSPATLEQFRAKRVSVTPGARGQSRIAQEAGTSVTLLLAVTAFVLLIACANIANLLLARGASRAAEMAVRLSIALIPADAQTMLSARLDGTTVVFSATVALGTGLLFGLFPALHSTRPDLVTAIKSTSGQPSGARSAAVFRFALATAQIALSTMLLVLAGLFVKSLANASRVDLGITTERLVTFSISPDRNGYTTARSKALFERIEDELAALPGVTAAGAAMVPLISGSNWGNGVSVQGIAHDPDADDDSMLNEIGPGYFGTVGMRLIGGRDFARSDIEGGPKVAIVNEAFARKFKLTGHVVGSRMGFSSGPDAKLDVEIVGLVKDAKYSSVKDATPPVYFTPWRQDDNLGSMTFYARTGVAEDAVLQAIPRLVARLDPALPVEELRSMERQIAESLVEDRVVSTLSASFAVVATILAAIGLYGVLAFTVAQRTREFGLRMALGADGGRVRRLVLGQVGLMTAIGAGIGLVSAAGIGTAAESQLFDLKGYDPGVLASATLVLASVAFAAGFVPALRASRVNPMIALRND